MECVVCSGPLVYAHLGVNACRACAVFYKRTVVSKTELKCRRGTGDCMDLNPQSNCRLCRFKKIQDILKRAVGDSNSNDIPSISEDAPSLDDSDDNEKSSNERYFLLERLRTQYRAMSHARLIGELNARGEVPHPLRVNVKAVTVSPCTYKSVQSGNLILFATAIEFGNVTFPEFESFTEKEKWEIITEFFYRFKLFEGCSRANELFPDHPERYFPNFTTYLGEGVYKSFYDSIPWNGDLEGATAYICSANNFQTKNVVAARGVLGRLQPDHEEFLAVLGLLFWSLDGIIVSHEISAIAEKYRKQIMKELHYYYRDKLNMDEYAMRLGELLMLLQIFDIKEEFREHVEMMRLLNLVDEESFVYQLQKE